MLAINRKLLRELWQMRMQVLTIALVIATGIMSVMTMRGTYESLTWSQSTYYQQTRFADVWAPLVRAPALVASRVADLPGVESIDTRITFLATLDLEGLNMPAQGRFVSVPEFGRPVLNDILIKKGRYIVSGEPDEVIINEKFALARGLEPGDSVKAVINGRSQALRIVGIANSPEHSYAVPPGSLFPEDERYGVFWMSEEILGPVYDMDGAFNELVARLEPGVNPEAVLDGIDDILKPYGGLGAYLRADQLSHQIIENELTEIRINGTIIPAIFLGVAVFLLYLVLGRLISTQRGQIAVLKAFGYQDWEVGRHYLMYAMLAVAIGSVIGGFGGIQLGSAMVNLYRQYLDIPNLFYRVTPSLLFIAISISVLGACAGALSAVHKAVILPPAEAMRPVTPARFKPGPIEKLGLGRILSASGRMILRNIERKPVQGFFSAIGVALSMAILVLGMFMFDSIVYMMDLQFRSIQREDLMLTFKEVMPDTVKFELANMDGVTEVETFRMTAARLKLQQHEEEIAVLGLDPQSQMRRIINADGNEIPIPDSGIVISALIAKRLDAKPGDALNVEWLEGKRLESRVTVSGIVEDFIGVSAYMSKQSLKQLTGDSWVVSGAFLKVEESQQDDLYAHLKQVPGIAGVSSPELMLETFNEELAKTINLTTTFLLGFACVIAVGVIYNGARISLSERGRELASLRVMGFHRKEVAILLLGEQALVTLLGIPLGCVIGYGLSKLIAGSIETDAYRIPFIADPDTYLTASVIIVLAAAASGLAVRRRLDKFDLVEVLKSKE
jgi:putative ABC transport system permease protein